ncbi:HORMA-1 domain-containing protein [Xanthocytophaga flava]|uniref:HORMA-1 domain-containing protein n=1 Tax=Xanthocytophaga flava TaxID=3048013 RepID=UPI0028D08E44|nr:hypothetical protein [Xanthocytophaga flavus]MDJ1466186.1 hypothetical protein [Xanthocytophaga flavus]
MSYSFTNSQTQTFTLTHAKYLASKVAADLKRMQRFYQYPSDEDITSYEAELIEYLKAGYLKEVTYGFKRNGDWIEPSLRYTAKELGDLIVVDDDPGKIRPGANVEGASFGSYLITTAAYDALSQSEKQNFEKALPLQRNEAPTPGINGYLSEDKTYGAGGKSLTRSSIKSN